MIDALETPAIDSVADVPRPATALVLTEVPDHPLYASWLNQVPFPVEYVHHLDLEYAFPAHTALIITHDCYREPNVTILRRATELQIPVLILADGTLEYSNLWQKRDLPPGSIFLPVLGHKIACFGRAQARVLESWGNVGRCEIVGVPRYDHYARLRARERAAGDPFRVLVATGMVPYHTEEHHKLVRQSLLDLKSFFASQPQIDGVPLEAVWRLTGELGREIGIESAITRQSQGSLLDTLLSVDTLISWPSTIMVDAMQLGLPVVALDYGNTPHYVQTAWRITVAEQIRPNLAELLNPPPGKRLFQETTLHDTLECATPAAPRMIRLAMEMMRLGLEARRAGQVLHLSQSLLGNDESSQLPPLASAQLKKLYPSHAQFQKTDLAALQVEVGHLRAYAATLEARLGTAVLAGSQPSSSETSRAHRLISTLPQAVLLAGKRSATGVWDVGIGGIAAPSLHLHPPVKMRFTLPTGRAGRFRTAVGIHPDAWAKPNAGGCEFEVLVDNRISFVVRIDPVLVEGDRRWHEIDLDVPASHSGRHEVVLGTACLRSADFVWAVWREPGFFWTESSSPE